MREAKNLSPRQEEIYLFISQYSKENSYSPSVSDIAASLELCNSTITSHLQALKRKGYLTSQAYMPRTFKLLKPAGIEAGGEL